ncbi:MAG TPA: helix-turn-helix domain-containing protein [Solirubrobacteraceae bacterium]|nr:helix-turn-helix domain-containing protein [Solirubrobacteraceae bacterium]
MFRIPSSAAKPVENIAVREPVAIKMFTRQSLAAYLDVHVNTIDRIVRRGELPTYRVSGRRRFYPDDVERYVREHRERA